MPQWIRGRGATVAVSAVVSIACAFMIAGCSTPPPLPHAKVAGSTPQKRLETLKNCLADAGWKVTITWDNGVQSDFDQSQQAAFSSADDKCTAESLKKFPVPVLNVAGQTKLFDQEIRNFQCIERHGVSLPAAPSLQVYLQTYSSNRWSASSELTPTAFPQLFKGSGQRYRAILTACRPPLWNQ